MPENCRLSIATLLNEDGWRRRTLKELYDTVRSDLRKELIRATGYSHPTAIGFMEHPYERTVAELVWFSRELGVSFEEVVLPMALNAMQRRTPTIHERMVVNPAPAVDEYEYEDPQTGAMQVARVPRLHVGDTVRVKGAQRAGVVEVDAIEGNALVEFMDGLTVWYPIGELELVEEEEEEEEEESINSIRRSHLFIRMKRARRILEDIENMNAELHSTMSEVKMLCTHLSLHFEDLNKGFVRDICTLNEAIRKVHHNIDRSLVELLSPVQQLELTADHGEIETPNPTYSR